MKEGKTKLRLKSISNPIFHFASEGDSSESPHPQWAVVDILLLVQKQRTLIWKDALLSTIGYQNMT